MKKLVHFAQVSMDTSIFRWLRIGTQNPGTVPKNPRVWKWLRMKLKISDHGNIGAGITNPVSDFNNFHLVQSYSYCCSLPFYRRRLSPSRPSLRPTHSRALPNVGFRLTNYLSGSTPPKSAKRERLAWCSKKQKFGNAAKNKIQGEDELIFFGTFF